MRPEPRLAATCDYGAGIGAGGAAKWRSRGEYRTAGQLEAFYGERRTWDDRGLTMHWRWMPEAGEFSARIRDGIWADQYGEPMPLHHWDMR